jgi:hypothetical protein
LAGERGDERGEVSARTGEVRVREGFVRRRRVAPAQRHLPCRSTELIRSHKQHIKLRADQSKVE